MDAGTMMRGATSAGEAESGDFVFRALFNRLSMQLAVVVLALTVVLPPDGLGLAVCWFEGLYGLPCPGCGMTRSLTSITHLRFEEAFGYHPFGFAVWALVLVLAVANFVGARRRQRLGEWLAARKTGARRAYLGFVLAFVAFGVVRLVVTAATGGAFAG